MITKAASQAVRFKNWNNSASGTSPDWWRKSASHWLQVCRNLSLGNRRVKLAELGGDQDMPFETAFANLANAYIRDKAPKLLDFMVGFQLIEKNQDNTKAVGVFGFKIGSQWLYVPVFFLNGDLKGHELLYIKNQDAFIPLKENWLNYLLGRKPSVLGETTDRNLSQLGVQAPHFYQLARSPYKFASAVAKWSLEILPSLAYFATTDPATDKKFSKVAGFADFVLETGAPTVKYILEKVASQYPSVFKAIDEFYPGLLDRALKNKVEKKASILADDPVKPTGPKPRLRIYDLYKSGAALNELDATEREELLREEVLVKDDRFKEEVTHAYNVIEPAEMQNPIETGLYEVLTRPGNFERCLVVMAPYSSAGRHQFCTVIRADGSRAFLNTHPANVWTKGQSSKEVFRKWLEDNGQEAQSLPHDGKWILLSPNGEGSAPFKVHDEYPGDEANGRSESYDVWFDDYAQDRSPEWLSQPPRERLDPVDSCCSCDSRIVLNKRPGSAMRAHGTDLFVPDNFRLIRVSPESDDEKREPIRPGRIEDVQMALLAETSALKIFSNGRMVSVNDQDQQTRKEAMISLVRDHGFRKEAADLLLKTAEKSYTKVAEFRVKYAEPIGDLAKYTPGAPSFPEPYSGGDIMTTNGYPSVLHSEFQLPVPDLMAANTDRNIYDPRGPDRRSMEIAQQAANSGQREVFDTAMLGSLLGVVRQENMIDRFLGDMMKGLDRLGRVLFLFYWHGEAFEDRYGKQDMPELEDSLRNAFEAVGDIVLALKRKSVEPFPDEGMDIDLGDTAN